MTCAGIGKTTLANEICLRWARDRFLSEDFDSVILIPMKCVHKYSLEKTMMEYIEEEPYQNLKKSAGSRCLIILDGLDEMATDHQTNDRFFIRLIKDCAVLEESTILITSRPHACDKLNANRHVEVIGFGTSEIKEFIKKSFPNDEGAVSKLLQQLNYYPHLKGLCYSPLNLVMITDIYQYSQSKELPSTITELYKLFLVMILQRSIMKGGQKWSDVSLTATNIEDMKKMLPGIPINAIGTVFLLCRLSFCGFFHLYIDMKEKDRFGNEKKWKDPKIIFTAEDLSKSGIEVNGAFDGFGLLKATHIHDLPRDTSAYNFSHLSIQEFLSSLYISLLPQQEQLHLMNEHFHDFPNVFIFLCGLARTKSNEMYQIVYSKMIPKSSCSKNSDVVPAIRSVYESNSFLQLQKAAPFTLDMSGNHLVLFDCFCVSHIISHYPVKQLKLQYCYIGDTNAEVLAKDYSNQKHANTLELLNLTVNDLTAVGMIHVMKIVMTSETHY